MPCSCLTDFFWENGNLFADRGLVASGFRVLTPVKFNGADWVNLNRADMTLAADLVNVRIPDLQARLAKLTVDDFVRKLCLGIEQGGQCWIRPPEMVTVYGKLVPFTDVCIPGLDNPDCAYTDTIPGIPSASFDYYPDFSKGGWTAVSDVRVLMLDITRVMAQFPAVVKGIPGALPSVDFKIPDVNSVLDFSSFKKGVDSFALFFARSSLFFDNFRNLVLDFTDPPASARCVNDTRHQVEPAGFRGMWEHWAFANQRELGKDEPFNWSTRLGTHNAFNNQADGYLAANQKWSISDQLDLGARWISLDLHWFSSGNAKIRLSHAQVDHTGASATDRYYANAIKEIAQWLRNNPREVVHISFEDRSAGAPRDCVIEPLEKYLGNKIYRRVEGNRPWRGGAYDPASQWPSLQQLRDLGKQVIIDSESSHGSDALWNDLPLPSRALGVTQAKNFSGNFASLRASASGVLIGPFDDTHIGSQYESRSWLDPFDSAGFLTAPEIAARVPYSLSLIALDMLQAQQYSSQCPGAGYDVCASPDTRIAAMVWSWKDGQPEDALKGPDNGEDCALFDGDSGRWESRKPSEQHYFACALPRGLDPLKIADRLGTHWMITEQSGPWEGGEAAVAALNRTLRTNHLDDDHDGTADEEDEGSYVFAAPVNAAQNERLKRALAAFRIAHNLPHADVWLACHDRLTPGKWMLSRSFPELETQNHPGSLAFKGDPVVLESYSQRLPQDEITIEFWQKADAQSAGAIVGLPALDAFGFQLSVQTTSPDGRISWIFGPQAGEFDNYNVPLSYRPPVPTTGSWQHFAMVASGSKGVMKIFRNGAEEASQAMISSSPTPIFPLLWIGQGFKGQLHDLRIWNVARTESQIRETLFRSLSGAEAGLVANWKLDPADGNSLVDSVRQTQSVLGGSWQWIINKPDVGNLWSSYVISKSPLLYHKLDESAGTTTAIDLSGRALHGTYVGASMERPSASTYLGTSVGLATSEGSHVALRNVGALDEFTLSFWVKAQELVERKTLFNSGTGTGSFSIRCYEGGAIGISIQDNVPSEEVLIPNALSQVGEWHHLTLSYNSSGGSGSLKVTLDGIPAANQSFSIAQRAQFNAPSLGQISTVAPAGTPFVIRARGGVNGTATLGGIAFDSIPADIDGLQSQLKIKQADTLTDSGAAWRTRAVTKALDVDQDYVLGSDGYLMVNLPSSLPPYVSRAEVLTDYYPGNDFYARLDSPLTPGASFLSGTLNPYPGPGTQADLLSFSLSPASAGRIIRVGLLVDNLDGAEWNAAGLELAQAGSNGASSGEFATVSPVLNNRIPDWIFFDIVGAGRRPNVCLDEFVLFPRAFSDVEIRALHQYAPDGQFLSFTPAPGQINVSSNLIRVVHLQGTVQWDPSLVSLKLDGTVVNAQVERLVDRQGDQVTISYIHPGSFSPSSEHIVSLTYPVGGGATLTRSWQFTTVSGSVDVVNQHLGLFTGKAAFTPSGGGRSGAPGDYAVDFGTTKTGESVHIQDARFLNEASVRDEVAVGGWQKLHSVTPAAFFWGISPSSSGEQRGWGTHAPWVDNAVYFDTAGCCDETQRTAESIYNFPLYPTPEDPTYWNAWHYLVFQKKQATKEIWIDGKLLVRSHNAAALPTDFTEAFIGYAAAPGSSMLGVVDDVAIFKNFLSPSDIARLASGTPATGLSESAGLMAYWNFNDLGTPAVIRVQAVPQGGGILRLSWSAGRAPFSVQRKSGLADGDWQTLLTTEATSADVSIQGGSGFFRVIGR